jgi:hypothetical protein
MKYSIVLLVLVITGCSLPQIKVTQPVDIEQTITLTPFQPVTITPKPGETVLPPKPTMQITEIVTGESIAVGLDDSIPGGLRNKISFPEGYRIGAEGEAVPVRFGALTEGETITTWVYALVAPFPTYVDNVDLTEILSTWRGEGNSSFGNSPLMMSESTRKAFEELWGPAGENGISIIAEENILLEAWNLRTSWAIIPFEGLEPKWKIIKVNGISPIQKNMDDENYPLILKFGFMGDDQLRGNLLARIYDSTYEFPVTNRDETKMTVLIMTGVTALVRATANKMEINGNTYPAQDILEWFQQADLIHISNEVSFKQDCPDPNPVDESLAFCSKPEYIELLDYIGANIIDLTGNHLNDKGTNALLNTLEMYRQHNMKYFAGGKDYTEAMEPLRIEHNGNKLAFLGCNWWGPPNVWATDNRPGAAPCDYAVLDGNIKILLGEGYLPIFTYQYFEIYTPEATSEQKIDFRARADAGAVIVSGSQAHRPQAMEFYGTSFIHYGLGNLFFDQTEGLTGPGTQDEFVDVYVFYDGRHISTELWTAYLENYSKPRPMTVDERRIMLIEIFSASGW